MTVLLGKKRRELAAEKTLNRLKTRPFKQQRSDDTSETVAQLRAKLDRYRWTHANRDGWARRFVGSGLTPLDEVLPGGGVPCGGVTEVLSDTPGVGAMTIAMRIALRAQTSRRFVVFVDTVGDFYPPAAWGVGIDPARLIVVRPRNATDAFWVVDQCLRCSGVAAVVAPLSKLDQRQSRRLQLAAESAGAVGLILRSAQRTQHSFASVRMLVEGIPAGEGNSVVADRREIVLCRVTLLSVREGNPAEPVLMDLNHVTGACDLYSVSVDRPIGRVG